MRLCQLCRGGARTRRYTPSLSSSDRKTAGSFNPCFGKRGNGDVFKYVELPYNRNRKRVAGVDLSPVDFEQTDQFGLETTAQFPVSRCSPVVGLARVNLAWCVPRTMTYL